MFSAITLASTGFALDIVGVIFLANAMNVRRPRRFLQEHFGVRRPAKLAAVLDQLRAKAEIFVGFLFLLVGFTLGIVAELSPVAAPAVAATLPQRLQGFLLLAAGVVSLAVLLRVACRRWSRALFRRLLAEFLEQRPDWSLEARPAVAREIGELLAVPFREDDAIEDYVGRVRAALGLGPEGRWAAPPDEGRPVERRLGAGPRF